MRRALPTNCAAISIFICDSEYKESNTSLLEATIEKMQQLPEDMVQNINLYVEFLLSRQNGVSGTNKQISPETAHGSSEAADEWENAPAAIREIMRNPQRPLTLEEYDLLADYFADEMEKALGPDAPHLSDYAVSREGIYADHP